MNKVRAAKLLASGLQAAQVATIVGCSPARIAQLQKEQDFQLILADEESKLEKQDVEEVSLTAKYHSAEHAVLQHIVEVLPGAELRDATAALRVISERQDRLKQRINPVTQGQVVHQNIVQLFLPAHALSLPPITVSNENEITSVAGKTLAPLSSEGVTNLFSALRAKQTTAADFTEGQGNEPARIPAIAEASPQQAAC